MLALGLRRLQLTVLITAETASDYGPSADAVRRRGWGYDFESAERQGLLRVVATYPKLADLEDHLVEMMREIEDLQLHRIAIDSLSALERGGTFRGFREFIIVLTSYVKSLQIAGLFTATTPTVLGGSSVTDHHISTLTDSIILIILLRYVDLDGAVKRGVTVLKMRGSAHDKRILEFEIDHAGIHIGEPFRGIGGILSGNVKMQENPEAPLRPDE